MDMSVKTDHDIAKLCFRIDSSGDLRLNTGTETIMVTTSLCFPWISTSQYISIRDAEDKEIHLINSLSELNEQSRLAIIDSLVAASFMLLITDIIEIKEEFEIRSWNVITKQGPYKFQTYLDYWPQILSQSSVIIRDVTGNIFYIDNTVALNEKSQILLWPFLD